MISIGKMIVCKSQTGRLSTQRVTRCRRLWEKRFWNILSRDVLKQPTDISSFEFARPERPLPTSRFPLLLRTIFTRPVLPWPDQGLTPCATLACSDWSRPISLSNLLEIMSVIECRLQLKSTVRLTSRRFVKWRVATERRCYEILRSFLPQLSRRKH